MVRAETSGFVATVHWRVFGEGVVTMAGRCAESIGGVLFEALEPRLLLDGNVVASVVKGSLEITGDIENNDITITQGGTGDEFVVTGNNDTTVNGGALDDTEPGDRRTFEASGRVF